jgi:G:T/U-mismatch repair DNA glycosylase
MVVNDFSAFFEQHRQLRLICFNGNTAAALFTRKVLPGLAADWAALERRALPSTSPAYASLRFEQKLARWREVLGGLVTLI